MNRLLSLLFISLVLCAHKASAAEFGYSNGSVGTSKTAFRLGTESRQGIAIRIPADKLAAIDGRNISSVSASFGTRNIESGSMRLFITRDLNSEPLVLQNISYNRALKWCDFSLDTPFTVNASEGDLYIGYYAELPTTSSSLLVGDKTPTSEGLVFGILDGQWIDVHGQGYGNPAIKFTVDDSPAVTDIILRPIDFNVYMKAGDEYEFSGALYNYGNEPLKDFDLSIQIGDEEPQSTHYDGLNILQSQSMEFKLPTLSSDNEGPKNIKVEISNINGASDSDNSDNVFDGSAYFYPENMERNILFEGFTGMMCPNCPAGHSTIHNFLANDLEVPVIEIMHHSGYQPDLLTNDWTQAYTYLYGSGQTFAPAIMINRNAVPEIGSVPVFQIVPKDISKAYNYAVQKEPYVSLALETEFDESTRLLKMQLKSYVHNDLPSDNNAINILLIQDNMTSDYFFQSGAGTGYVHTNVTRDAPLGNAWGLQIPSENIKAGSETVWTGEYTIPEGYTTSYLSGSSIPEIPAYPKDMYLVAYTSSFGATPAEFNIYNSIKVKVGESHTQNGIVAGIGSVSSDSNDTKIYYADGMVMVEGVYDSLNVYNMEGREVGSRALTPGIYVVKVIKGHNTISKKIAVR